MPLRWLCLTCALLSVVALPHALAPPGGALTPAEESRLQRMRLDEIVSALGARAGRHIADLGAGEGTFTAALAPLVGPQGKVYAVDINEATLKRLRSRFAAGSAVEVIEGAEDNPHLPAGALDAVLLVDTYH